MKIINKIKEWIKDRIYFRRIINRRIDEIYSMFGERYTILNNLFNRVFEELEYLKIKTMTKEEKEEWLKKCLEDHKKFINFAKMTHSMDMKLKNKLGNEAIFKYKHIEIKIQVIPVNYDRWEFVLNRLNNLKNLKIKE